MFWYKANLDVHMDFIADPDVSALASGRFHEGPDAFMQCLEKSGEVCRSLAKSGDPNATFTKTSSHIHQRSSGEGPPRSSEQCLRYVDGLLNAPNERQVSQSHRAGGLERIAQNVAELSRITWREPCE